MAEKQEIGGNLSAKAVPEVSISPFLIENFKMEVKESYIDKLIGEFGAEVVNAYREEISNEEYIIQKKIDPFFEQREQEYTLNKAEVVELLDYIVNKTDYTYSKISSILFNNSSLIQQKIDHNRVETEIINNVKKNVRKFGLKDIPSFNHGRNKWFEWQNKGIAIFTEPTEIRQGIPTSNLSAELGIENILFTKINTSQWEPTIPNGSIIIVSENNIYNIKDNHYYLFVYKDGGGGQSGYI